MNIIVDLKYRGVYIHIVSASTSRKTNIPSLLYCAVDTIYVVTLKFLVGVFRSILHVDRVSDFW